MAIKTFLEVLLFEPESDSITEALGITDERADELIEVLQDIVNNNKKNNHSTITDDIKAVVYEIVWYLYNSMKTSWIKSFTQWQISITYDDWKQIQSILDNSVWLKKYIKNDIIC